MKKQKREPPIHIVNGGPEKTLQTDAVMAAHAMREKPLCYPCLL